jgi:hydrogenase maturation protease
MGDDSVGLALLDLVRERYELAGDVLTLDGDAWTIHMMPLIQRARRLVLLAALDLGERPGTLIVLEGAAVLRHFAEHPTAPWCNVCEALDDAELDGTGALEILAVGVQPGPAALGLELSPCARAALEAAAHLLSERLAAWGQPCEPHAATV